MGGCCWCGSTGTRRGDFCGSCRRAASRSARTPTRPPHASATRSWALVAGRLDRLLTLYPTPGFCTETMTYYRATELRAPREDDAPAHQDEDESIEVEAFSLDEIRGMIARGEIADLKTVAALSLGAIAER